MMRISPQHTPAIVVVSLATASLIVTVMLIASLWSGSRLASRISSVNLRLDPPIEETENPQQDQKSAEGQEDPHATPPGKPENGKTDKKEEETPAPPDLAVARMKSKNMFVVPEKPEFRNILGILGDRVLYPDGISLKVGDTHNGATVKEIGSNWVKLEYEGEIIPLGVYGGTPPPEPESESEPNDGTDEVEVDSKKKEEVTSGKDNGNIADDPQHHDTKASQPTHNIQPGIK